MSVTSAGSVLDRLREEPGDFAVNNLTPDSPPDLTSPTMSSRNGEHCTLVSGTHEHDPLHRPRLRLPSSFLPALRDQKDVLTQVLP
jgi:hypothetical protein